MKNYLLAILSIGLAVFYNLAAAETSRWYASDQVSRGESLFQQNCATCHGADGESVSGENLAANQKAAPALNGSAHTWHHSYDQLKKTIKNGGVQIGGSMPAFGKQLSDTDIENVIAYFQSKWPDKVYTTWSKRFKTPVATKQPVDIAELLKLRLGTEDITPPVETDIKGVYQTQFGDKFAYLIENGRYVFIGDLVDLKLARNLTEISRRDIAKNVLAQVPLTDTVTFQSKGKELTVLSVFTDTSCAYCQKLHAEVGYLQDAGISVRYIPFPRGGNRGPGYEDLKSVWCASDPLAAMDIAKGVSTGQLTDGKCERAVSVDKGFATGMKLGVDGTPALYSANGTKFNGYVPYDQLIPMLLNEL